MRILLTGSTGWLGRYLAPMLRDAGHQVIGLDVAPGPDTRIVGSVANRALIERVMFSHGIEGVIHAGALHKPDIVRYPRQAFVDVNVTGTLNLPEGVEMVMPGDNITMEIELIAPIAMEQGSKFAIREGGRTVGAGAITEIIK